MLEATLQRENLVSLLRWGKDIATGHTPEAEHSQRLGHIVALP